MREREREREGGGGELGERGKDLASELREIERARGA